MSTQAYYKERLGFDPADTVAEHHREQRSQHGYEESLSKFKGQNGDNRNEKKIISVLGDLIVEDNNGDTSGASGGDDDDRETDTSSGIRTGGAQAFWGCWAKFIEAHGRSR